MGKISFLFVVFLFATSISRAGNAELYVIEATIPPTPSVTESSTSLPSPTPEPTPHLVKPSAKNLAKMKALFDFGSGISGITGKDDKLFIVRDPEAAPLGDLLPKGTHFTLRAATDEELASFGKESKAEEEPVPTMDYGLDKLEMQLGFGANTPESGSRISENYGTGSAFSWGFGIKATKSFTVLWVLEYGSFNGNNNPAGTSSQFDRGDTALLGKLRFASGDFRPYVYAGPGLEFNNYNFNYTYNGLPTTANLNAVDFMAEAGVGFEVQMVPTLFLFVQGGLDYDLVPQGFADTASIDRSAVYFPVLCGIVWGR